MSKNEDVGTNTRKTVTEKAIALNALLYSAIAKLNDGVFKVEQFIQGKISGKVKDDINKSKGATKG